MAMPITDVNISFVVSPVSELRQFLQLAELQQNVVFVYAECLSATDI
jgi:hypothetical protein